MYNTYVLNINYDRSIKKKQNKTKGRIMEFKKLGICTPVLKVLKEQSYISPTPIQEKTIPQALVGKDILGLAQTGTGKTAAFSIPTLQLLAERKQKNRARGIKALILTPTRELALQVYESFTVYGRYLPMKSTVIFGGVGQEKQIKALKSNVEILVATPGRLLDLINQGHVDISGIEFFILDEADRMLDMGFIHDVRRIIKYLPTKKQTMLFSATMPNGIGEIVSKLLVDPVKVVVSPVSSTVDVIEQYVYHVDKEHKIDILAELLNKYKNEPVLVFTRTKGGADRVVKHLAKRNIKSQAIHGGKSQNARQNALENFKNAEISALVATDIASRGIDINELKYVVNYDLPEVPETYVHRIGRTGRAGNQGTAFSFCNFQEIGLLKDIEKLIKKKIDVIEHKEYPMVDFTAKEKGQQKRGFVQQDKEVGNKPNTKKARDYKEPKVYKDSKAHRESKEHKESKAHKDFKTHKESKIYKEQKSDSQSRNSKYKKVYNRKSKA